MTSTPLPTSRAVDTVPSTMLANVLAEAGKMVMEERRVPTCDPDQVLIRVAAVGVCGSDVHYFREGRLGDFVVDSSLVLGHELSGTIVAVGSDLDPTRVGQRVAVEPQRPCAHCQQCRRGQYNLCPKMEFYATPPIDGAFAEYVVIQDAFAHTLPDSVSFETGALLEPLSVAVASVRKAQISPASSVLIAGAGPIGLICAQAAKAFGASRIVVTDVVEGRRARALEYGATEVLDPIRADEQLKVLGVDSFIDASGSPSAVDAGIRALRPAGTAVLVGLGHSTMKLPVEQIQNLELNVTGIFRYVETWPTAIHLVASGLVELDSLVTGRFLLDEAQRALESDQDPTSLKSMVLI